jgi:hypothetical protein
MLETNIYKLIADTAQALEDIETIAIVRNGPGSSCLYTSLDNRRLLCFKQALPDSYPIPANVFPDKETYEGFYGPIFDRKSTICVAATTSSAFVLLGSSGRAGQVMSVSDQHAKSLRQARMS